VENASSLWRDRDQPASGRAGLISKARGDYRRILASLYGEGYYGPEISIRAAGSEVADLTLAADLPPDVPMAIDVRAGPRFRFGQAAIVNGPPFLSSGPDEVDGPASVGFETGEPARADAVGAASALAVDQWRQLARAKAREVDRELVADHPRRQLDARVVMDPGPAVRYGPVRAVGSQRTDADFIEYMADLPRGAPFDPDDLRESEDRLSDLAIFRSLRIEESDDIGPDGSMPLTIVVQDRAPRTIGFGGTYSTLDGLGLSAFWVNRNLYGRAERLRFDASIERLLQTTDPSEYNYNLGVTYTQPGVFNPDTSFVTSLLARQLDFDTYRERSISTRAGFSRRFGRYLTGDLFLEASRGRYEDDFGTRNFTTLSLIGRGEYDRRDDPLNATEGYYIAADARPFYEFNYSNAALRGTLEGRGYLGLGEEKRFVLAGRAKIGSLVGAEASETPPSLLFFAGGGGSVRGYAYQSIGVNVPDPDDPDETIVAGGLGLAELSGEFRARIGESFGAVAFVDGGLVSSNSNFSNFDDLRIGVGLGARYFTAVGPLRVDLAVPLEPLPDSDPVALYIGIGQAF
jgi:translocation and assembly module TamA